MPDEPPAGAAQDPLVAIAFALGWQMADLYRAPVRQGAIDPKDKVRLPGVGGLPASVQTGLGIKQICAGLKLLEAAFTKAAVTVPNVDAVKTGFQSSTSESLKESIYLLHVDVLTSLTAADFRLGKAYGLGRALAESVQVDTAQLKTRWQPARMTTVQSWLNDLDSQFPAHSARAVAISIDRWRDWINDAANDGAVGEIDTKRRLLRQGRQWRALLSDEKQGVDMLAPRDYVTAAARALDHARALARQVIVKFRELAALGFALVVLGIVLALESTETAKILAGAGAVIGGLGLTWKTVGSGFSALIARLRTPVWGAELNEAIADRITSLPGTGALVKTPPSGPDLVKLPEEEDDDD